MDRVLKCLWSHHFIYFIFHNPISGPLSLIQDKPPILHFPQIKIHPPFFVLPFSSSSHFSKFQSFINGFPSANFNLPPIKAPPSSELPRALPSLNLSFSSTFPSLKLTTSRPLHGGARMSATAASSYATALADVAKSNDSLDSTSSEETNGTKMLQIRLSKIPSTDSAGTPKASPLETLTVACPDHLVLADLPVAKSIGAATSSSLVKTIGRR